MRAGVSNKASARVEFLRDMGAELVALPDMLEDEGWEGAMAGCAGLVFVTLHPTTPSRIKDHKP